jgi:hypothetical protein
MRFLGRPNRSSGVVPVEKEPVERLDLTLSADERRKEILSMTASELREKILTFSENPDLERYLIEVWNEFKGHRENASNGLLDRNSFVTIIEEFSAFSKTDLSKRILAVVREELSLEEKGVEVPKAKRGPHCDRDSGPCECGAWH